MSNGAFKIEWINGIEEKSKYPPADPNPIIKSQHKNNISPTKRNLFCLTFIPLKIMFVRDKDKYSNVKNTKKSKFAFKTSSAKDSSVEAITTKIIKLRILILEFLW